MSSSQQVRHYLSMVRERELTVAGSYGDLFYLILQGQVQVLTPNFKNLKKSQEHEREKALQEAKLAKEDTKKYSAPYVTQEDGDKE